MTIMIKFNDQLKINRSEWILGCSNYCQATWKQKHKTKINQETIIKNNRKIKNKKIKAMRNITPTMDHYLKMNRW